MARRPNDNPPHKPGIRLTFTPGEAQRFRLYTTGGGLQQLVNWYYNNIDRDTQSVLVPPNILERTIRYIENYGPGGPNKIIRDSCGPALHRAGITVKRGLESRGPFSVE